LADIELDYDSLMQEALKRVVFDVLTITSELGETPGEHHFYIEFLTNAPGVSIPEHLKEAYPTRMTIVLHHQFEDLNVTQDGFSVTLWFKGVEAALMIPFDAITNFADPSAKFGLRFAEEDLSLDIPGMNADDGENSNQERYTDNVEDFQSDRAQPKDKKKNVEKVKSQNDGSKKANAKNENDKAGSQSTDAEILDSEAKGTDDSDKSAEVVSLDAFRKK